MKKVLIALALATLVGCSSLEESVGIDDTDNAFQCVTLSVNSPNPFMPGTATTKRIEGPVGFDVTKLTPELGERLMEWCD